MNTTLSSILTALASVVLVAAAFAARAEQPDKPEWIADQNGCKVANPFPRVGETIAWSGSCKDGFAEGQGTLQWFLEGVLDDRYEGNLTHGWAEGRGTLYRADGGKYEGEWKDSLQDGDGRYEAPDGSWYEGQWRAGKPHGQGKYRRSDGKLFTGQWIDGVYEGDIEPQQDDTDDPNRT